MNKSCIAGIWRHVVLTEPKTMAGGDWFVALAALTNKAAELTTAFTGARLTTDILGSGDADKAWVWRYERCDIYFSPRSGDVKAYEIHGGIREKYRRINGYALLGAPVTDERTCPDGTGRYNHFERGGSIYWHPDTGPHVVRGPIRTEWGPPRDREGRRDGFGLFHPGGP